MVLRGALGPNAEQQSCSLLVDTMHTFTLALDGEAWAKAGVKPSELMPIPGGGQLRHGILPTLRLGAFDIPQVPGILGDSVIKDRETGLDVELDGLVGSGLLATFRVTLVDGGRTMWLEDLPQEALNAPSLMTTSPSAIDQNFDDEAAVEEPESAPKGKPGQKSATPKSAPAAPPKPSPAPPPANSPPGGGKP
jgi:hypothetical protein